MKIYIHKFIVNVKIKGGLLRKIDPLFRVYKKAGEARNEGVSVKPALTKGDQICYTFARILAGQGAQNHYLTRAERIT